MIAAHKGNVSALAVLIKMKADPEITDNNMLMVIDHASAFN